MEKKDNLTVAAVQFEMTERDVEANLEIMFAFIDRAADAGADIICFPEYCTTACDWIYESNREELLTLAECTKTGSAVTRIHAKARERNIVVIFGMLEKDADGNMFNTAVVVTPEGGNVFQHRKVHAFENSAISQGDRLDVFELFGWTMGILTCYDNNLPENPRILCLKGAEIIFAPHQTGGFDLESAGMGKIDLDVWRNRHKDPRAARVELNGPKGREWVMKWWPSRAYDNNLYYVYANGIGIDGPEVRTGGTMIVDPEGIVLEEATALGDQMIIAHMDKSARVGTVGSGNVASRRPSLYGMLAEAIEERDTREIRNSLTGHTIK